MHMNGTKEVGNQDPSKRNSPVLDESDALEFVFYERHNGTSCFFNDRSYSEGSFVCSGTTLLRCDHGLWVIAGNSDPDNP